MKVGVIIGKFYPLTRGHKAMIDNILKKVDKLYVCPTFTHGETIPIGVRAEWIRDLYKDVKAVVVHPIVKQLGDSADGKSSDENVARKWAEYLKKKFPDLTHFGGSEPYIKMMADSIDAEHITYDVERKAVPISATHIRNDFDSYKGMCASDKVANEYVKKICILGIESSGKTTLARGLAHDLGVELVEEYGRTYCEVNSPLEDGKDYFLTKGDFENIALGHNKLVLKGYEKSLAKGNKILLVDTDHVTTQEFYKRYLGGENDLIKGMIDFQSYDMYIVLNPLPLEDDGTRRIVSDDERADQHRALVDALQKSRDYDASKVVYTFLESFEKRMKRIKKILGVN